MPAYVLTDRNDDPTCEYCEQTADEADTCDMCDLRMCACERSPACGQMFCKDCVSFCACSDCREDARADRAGF